MGNIASMLASSGANIGANIGNPLAQFGQNIGGMLTAKTEANRKQEEATEVQKLLEENKNNPAQLNALYQRYASQGKTDLANLFKQAAEAAVARQQRVYDRGDVAVTRGKERSAAVTKRVDAMGDELEGMRLKSRAAQMALQRGDTEAAQAIRSGLMDPKDYVSKAIKPREPMSSADRFKTVGNRIFDVQEQRYIEPSEVVTEKTDKAFELIEDAKYTPQSIQDAVNPDGSLDYSKLVPVSNEEKITRGKVSSAVETRIGKINEESTKASVSLSRNRALQQQLLANPDKSTGIVSQLRTSALDLAGLRDAEEEAKTAFLRTRNTDIVNKLPPGAASDRDIEVFSAGFPNEDAGTEEIIRYLQAEARILAASSDMSLLADRHIASQINQGQDATMVGFEDKKQKYGEMMKIMTDRINQRVAAGEDRITVEQEELKILARDLGFTPKFYR